jgi:hypothetical protein
MASGGCRWTHGVAGGPSDFGLVGGLAWSLVALGVVSGLMRFLVASGVVVGLGGCWWS